MNRENFNNECYYQTTMNIVRQMLDNGLITKDEYTKIDTIFIEKYRPILGSLFSK